MEDLDNIKIDFMEMGYGSMEWFRTVYMDPKRYIYDSYVIY
jgi:hypothetical protein